jgi:uncharacterized protein
MSVEVRPLGVKCNLACSYCYQDPQRDAGNIARSYDMEAMKQALILEGRPFSIFGGEPLLVPLPDLEALLRFGFETYGYGMIQTNGSLVTDAHIALFKTYNVLVGISMDGPEAMNDARRQGNSLALTREATVRSEQAISRLLAAGVSVSLIVTLHRLNADAEGLPALAAWLQEKAALGVRTVRLHLLEVENEMLRAQLALSPAENAAAMLYFHGLRNQFPAGFIDILSEMTEMLSGDDRKAACVWRGCDPYTTAAVRGVEGNGQRSNCGRTNKDGIDFVKAAKPGFERYVALWASPESAGGCQGCRFFLACKGYCPGTAEGGDWRQKTEHCGALKQVFAHVEEGLVSAGKMPISLDPRRQAWEQSMVQAWLAGENPELHRLVAGLVAPLPAVGLMPSRVSFVNQRAADIWGARLPFVAKALLEVTVRQLRAGSLAWGLVRLGPWQTWASVEREIAHAGLQFAPCATGLAPTDAPADAYVVWAPGRQPAWAEAQGQVRLPQDVYMGMPQVQGMQLTGLASATQFLWPLGWVMPATTAGFATDEAAVLAALSLMDGEGFSTEAGWLRELLGCNAQITCDKGVGELKLPLFKMVFPCPATDGMQRYQWQGQAMPEHSQHGLHFPFLGPRLVRKAQKQPLEAVL